MQVIILIIYGFFGCTPPSHKTITAVEKNISSYHTADTAREITIRMTGNDLFDNCLVVFKDALVNLPTFHLRHNGRDVFDASYYSTSFVDDTRKKVRFTFSPKVIRYENEHQGRTYTLEIATHIDSRLSDFAHRYAAAYTFGGTNWYKKLILPVIAGLVMLNILLVVLVVCHARTRTVLLVSTGLPGILSFPARYLFTHFLLHHNKHIRLALFKNYRRQYRQLPAITRWQQQRVQYVPPIINGLHCENAWQQAFDAIMHSPLPLHVLIGRSGLGKTALLEQWTHRALNQNRTPVLLCLGEESTIDEALSFQMKHYGGLPFSPQQARDIVASGGFVLLLDGFSESSKQEAVRQFILLAAKNNKVIVTSQNPLKLATRWQEARIHLEPFGKKQLNHLFTDRYQLDASYVDRLLGHSLLVDMAAIPHTAKLLARYIITHDQLPAFRMDVYKALRQTIHADLQLLNLEYKAWQLFRNNSQEFKPDEHLPAWFCEEAAEACILTRDCEVFRFRHERLQRYFAARYLQWQDERPMEAWHQEIRPGLGRTYWADALEMWHELKIDSLLRGQLTLAAYEDFVLRIAAFSPEIYATRIAGAIALFEQAGRLNMTNGYWVEIGRILAVQRKPPL